MVRPPKVRKARKSSTLACGHYVTPGNLIVTRGLGWMCLACALKRLGRTEGEQV